MPNSVTKRPSRAWSPPNAQPAVTGVFLQPSQTSLTYEVYQHQLMHRLEWLFQRDPEQVQDLLKAFAEAGQNLPAKAKPPQLAMAVVESPLVRSQLNVLPWAGSLAVQNDPQVLEVLLEGNLAEWVAEMLPGRSLRD